jgi:single-strand DNA-binding protein
MMIQASIYGRIGREPKAGTTKAGKPMTTATLAVEAGKEGESETLWVNVLAFAENADKLVKHQSGDMVAVTGRLNRGKYTGRDGVERESWSMMVDSLHSSRTVRPGSTGRKTGGQADRAPPAPTSSAGGFDDDIPY